MHGLGMTNRHSPCFADNNLASLSCLSRISLSAWNSALSRKMAGVVPMSEKRTLFPVAGVIEAGLGVGLGDIGLGELARA